MNESDYVECKNHENCGGWCETQGELSMKLCSNCLQEFYEDENIEKYNRSVMIYFTKIASYVNISPANPKEVADEVFKRLKEM